MEKLFLSYIKLFKFNVLGGGKMCGIAGIINKDGMDIASTLINMLSLIQHRGPDASGIAVYGMGEEILLRVTEGRKGLHDTLIQIVEKYASITGEKTTESRNNIFYSEIILNMKKDYIEKLHQEINEVDGLYVNSCGEGMKVYKDSGLIDNLLTYQTIDRNTATHGIGHVRMATESGEDVNAAHPFVSPFYSDLSIVHNGQFTNYFNLRRKLENKGAKFKTLNDTEAASHLIAYAMSENGGDLEGALHYASDQFDGIYCIIASTSDQIGIAKDKLGIKPMLIFEKDGTILLGSEQIEFTPIFPDVYAEEIEPGEVRVWNL